MLRLWLCMSLLLFAAFGQVEGPAARFEIVDIHPSSITVNQFVRGPFISGVRYDMRNASIVDLIAKAYDMNTDKVLEGPSWLEYDRFDISATVPPRPRLPTPSPCSRHFLATVSRSKFIRT